jgi:5'-nucleotidase (lipoprotein e(P4) family)
MHATAARPGREHPRLSRLGIGALLLAMVGCAGRGGTPAPSVAPPPVPAAATPPAVAAASAAGAQPKEIHWVRSSAEYQALTRQTYRMAEERAREAAAGRARGTWAVILDGDETVVDNSEYQRRIAERGEVYQTATWQAWVRERRARAVPGVREFLNAVASLGGRVVIVTNRDDVICDDTRANIRALLIPFDLVLCRVGGVSDKAPRFAAVANGTAAPGALPALEVVLWVGDNVLDFPQLTQALRDQGEAAYDRFGRTYILLPNPMYGSWETNAPR